MLYCSWDMAHDRYNCYFSFWTIFCPLTAPNTKISKKWKEKKKPGDVIILQKCTINYDHMVYCSWYMACDNRCDCYFSFWAIFCHFTPQAFLKNENFKKIEKNTRRYHQLTQVHRKSWSYVILFLRYGTWCM